MTALSSTPRPTATSRMRPSGVAALAVGFLACLSGTIPAAFVLLAF
ncbi:hypothetical protein SAMN05216207_109514 [Pseudonocardia ammonioxydans]|uniref:Uncharacterized protein n=1 Tax=Pseudonocardia ammonioxydans TaxID=260086 RepID=A0A1I5ICQ6_PSUAM|nr:hypothetical protein [Pseudonocardia ammonioxydans]SFO58050.1 hypothetical protein SAMN05216207_109514 [Pseudonocardia ammonioxydans]